MSVNLRSRKPFSLSEKERLEAANAAALAGSIIPEIQLKSGGQELTTEKRDELLRKCAAGEYVELTLKITAYEQKNGQRNRNYVRIAESAAEKFAKSLIGKPFLRDHSQYNSLNVGGMIVECGAELKDDGHFLIKQEAEITAPWMVELALRKLLSFVSVSWMATGPVECSHCKVPILTKCWHWPGDKFSLVEDKITGGKKLQWDRNGSIVIEWLYTSVEGIETSSVPVPAVTSAKIDGIRLSLAASHDIIDERIEHGAHELPKNAPDPQEKKTMEKTEKEIALEAQVDRLEKINNLSAAEREYFNRLSRDRQDWFLKLSAADRQAELAPVYTASDGTIYNKSHDPSTIALAKKVDEQEKRHAEELASSKSSALLARVDAELGHLPGTREERAALLGAIEAIKDDKQREFAMLFLTSTEKQTAKKFVRQGAGGAKKPVKFSTAQAKLEELVTNYMKENPDCDDRDVAMGILMESSEEAIELYTEIEKEKVHNRLRAQGATQEAIDAAEAYHAEKN